MNKEIGACISLQPNASKIATQFGLDRFLESKGPMNDTAFRIRKVSGELQTEISLKFDRYGACRRLFHRVDLHDALKTAATSDDLPGMPASIRAASRVVHCDCDEGIVVLETGKKIRADMIIGADGIHSVIREFVAGKRHDPMPTGISAVRALVPTSELLSVDAISAVLDVREPVTTMIIGHDRRIVMSPARDGQIFGAILLVPDEATDVEHTSRSWTSSVSHQTLLKNLEPFPEWIQAIFTRNREDAALWQLRDIDPLPTWVKGRTILIGDAAHAMLPTQGQGASQSFEDAEALQAMLKNVSSAPSKEEINKRLNEVFDVRYERASLIQKYSRQHGRSGADKDSGRITLDPGQFMDYNCRYEGAQAWKANQQRTRSSIVA